MSRVGKKPINIPEKVNITLDGNNLKVKGPNGELERLIHPMIKLDISDKEILVLRLDETKESRSLHGLFRSLIANMVNGVVKHFEKKLDIVGIGYKAQYDDKKHVITLNLGYSHPIKFEVPKELIVEIPKQQNSITLKGIDKELVGQVAAKIRMLRKVEPYKGKGIKYSDEVVLRKEGKKGA